MTTQPSAMAMKIKDKGVSYHNVQAIATIIDGEYKEVVEALEDALKLLDQKYTSSDGDEVIDKLRSAIQG